MLKKPVLKKVIEEIEVKHIKFEIFEKKRNKIRMKRSLKKTKK